MNIIVVLVKIMAPVVVVRMDIIAVLVKIMVPVVVVRMDAGLMLALVTVEVDNRIKRLQVGIGNALWRGGILDLG